MNSYTQPVFAEKKRVAALKEMPGARTGQVYELTRLGVSLPPSVVHVHPCHGAEGAGAARARGAAPVRLRQGCEGRVHCPEKPLHGSPQ